MANKLTSRKFWVAVAAALGSIGTGITGLVIGDLDLTKTGAFLLVLSGGIYAFCEAYVDGKSVGSTTVTTQITASTSGDTTARVVDTVLPVTDADKGEDRAGE